MAPAGHGLKKMRHSKNIIIMGGTTTPTPPLPHGNGSKEEEKKLNNGGKDNGVETFELGSDDDETNEVCGDETF